MVVKGVKKRCPEQMQAAVLRKLSDGSRNGRTRRVSWWAITPPIESPVMARFFSVGPRISKTR